MGKNKGGRPKIQYNNEIAKGIQGMSQYGIPLHTIAEHYQIDAKTMRKLYARELSEGRLAAKLKISKTLYQRCIDGDTSCLIFYAKTQLGWNERMCENSIGREILEKYKNGELTLKETALEFEMNNLPLPETIRIMLAKEQPEPEDVSKGQYMAISDEEMEERIKQRVAEMDAQREGLPERRKEIIELRKEVVDKFKPVNDGEDSNV